MILHAPARVVDEVIQDGAWLGQEVPSDKQCRRKDAQARRGRQSRGRSRGGPGRSDEVAGTRNPVVVAVLWAAVARLTGLSHRTCRPLVEIASHGAARPTPPRQLRLLRALFGVWPLAWWLRPAGGALRIRIVGKAPALSRRPKSIR